MIQATKKYPALLPIASCLLAATLWGISWYPLRLLEQQGINGLWATILIYAVAFLVLIPFMMRQAVATSLLQRDYLMICLASGWANTGFILAVLEGNVVRVLLLFYLSPVWTIIFSKILLRETLTRMGVLTVIIAMSGAVIMLGQPALISTTGISTADIYAVSAGMAFALMNVLLRKTVDLPLTLKVGLSAVGVIAVALTGLAITVNPLPVLTINNLLLVFLLGSVGLLLMTYAAQFGVTHLPTHRSAVLFLFEIVAGAVSAAWWGDEVMSWREWLGGLAVVIAALITAYDYRLKSA